jgi:hypothetical protein
MIIWTYLDSLALARLDEQEYKSWLPTYLVVIAKKETGLLNRSHPNADSTATI